ncbi:hypothetical protein BDK51DRAFT_47816 [Blyttiomyces helicus]|uniref:Uncharacterized protein n=1 Tax=Blyttiomyces helicus TaxID=388810 RepID=A0A4P9W0K7_9FUNG|nr:hypothetical protein BDK51DRAFT_47816 [Blyttiomyces helicus]|eukprot:RKO85624.1 hypothetical protein BDK51DRAFT_47816 [Blyttiomyces helicus]
MTKFVFVMPLGQSYGPNFTSTSNHPTSSRPRQNPRPSPSPLTPHPGARRNKTESEAPGRVYRIGRIHEGGGEKEGFWGRCARWRAGTRAAGVVEWWGVYAKQPVLIIDASELFLNGHTTPPPSSKQSFNLVAHTILTKALNRVAALEFAAPRRAPLRPEKAHMEAIARELWGRVDGCTSVPVASALHLPLRPLIAPAPGSGKVVYFSASASTL